MRYKIRFCGVLAVIAIGILAVSCEWEEADGWNTSQGAGVDVLWSGVYTPRTGSYIVGTNVTRMVLTQVGNTIQISDDNGMNYSGTVGSPGVQAGPNSDGIYQSGTVLLQSQIYFSTDSGTPDDSDDDVEFVGMIHAIAVTEIETSSSTIDISEDELTSTTTRQFDLTEANTRYVLEGNWIQGDGTVLNFAAWARASGGSFTVQYGSTQPTEYDASGETSTTTGG